MSHATCSSQGYADADLVAARKLMAYPSISAVRADAVFVSGLQRGDEPSAREVRRAAAEAIRAFGCSGCAGRVAQEFGDHPERAVIRMRWARGVVGEAFADSPPGSGPGADLGGFLVVGGPLSRR